MTSAYRVRVAGRGDARRGLRSRLGRGRPDWWLILAVSLALMALLAASAGGRHPARAPVAATQRTPTGPRPAGPSHRSRPSPESQAPSRTSTAASKSPAVQPQVPSSGTSTDEGAAGLTRGPVPAFDMVVSPAPPSPATPTTVATTTTTTTTGGAREASIPGYLDPPAHPSSTFDFTGAGPTRVSAVWSGSTFLTMEVSCPDGTTNVGGTGVMAAALPDAVGDCTVTVSEPSSEEAPLTYTITIGAAGG